MTSTFNKTKIITSFLLLFLSGGLLAQDLPAIANTFLGTLSTELKDKTLFALEDLERFNMNYVPITRQGATFHDFNEVQKTAALKLLRACLSED